MQAAVQMSSGILAVTDPTHRIRVLQTDFSNFVNAAPRDFFVHFHNIRPAGTRLVLVFNDCPSAPVLASPARPYKNCVPNLPDRFCPWKFFHSLGRKREGLLGCPENSYRATVAVNFDHHAGAGH
jgi:hypothetical protein